VAVVLTPDPDSILLIRRAERTGDPWSGHMAFPGGRRQTEDTDLLSTAMRETAEEVGMRLSRDEVAGSLDDVVPRTPVLPPIAVRPYLFILKARPAISLNAEVASADWVTLDQLRKGEVRHPVRLQVAGKSHLVQAYQLEGGTVWGMTERILTNLVSLI
jgi:8-oxo-dGTP pyrophosphatase MutT (NUDIX family)